MRRKLCAVLCCVLCLTGCAAPPEVGPGASASPPATLPPSPSPSPASSLSPSPAPSPEDEVTPGPGEELPLSDEEIIGRYAGAIAALEPTVTLNVGGREWKYGAENDLKNLYYQVTFRYPELKYAYDMTARVEEDQAECAFFYMPYKTGAYEEGLPAGSHTVGCLRDVYVMAQSMIDGKERLSIAITDPALEVEDLQRAAMQGGYGWITCALSRDGTELVASPPVGMELADCVENINESFRLAGEILEGILTDGMTDREKVEAAYSYLTQNVAYDFRYYSDKSSMPFTSTVALGALRDSLAICGGYSHALKTLLDLCGIESYTVSGVSHGEYHAWNYVVLDGAGYYCDPTADRGGTRSRLLLTEEEMEALGVYEWEAEFYRALRLK